MRCLLHQLVFSICYLAIPASSWAAPPLWQQLMPRKQVETDPQQDYSLSETRGPWLVMAASFSGEDGKSQADELIVELRNKYNLPAYYYGIKFELDDVNRGIDHYGAPIKRRYNRGEEVVEHAVLVGEFPAVDDPEAQTVLETIKHLNPESLSVSENEETSQSLASVRQFYESTRQKLNPNKKRGPMGHAFLTRNPLLPKEYFVPQGVESEVAKWNEGLEFNLMKCPGKYSIRVATFRGKVSLISNSKKEEEKPRRSSDEIPLATEAQNAHKLALALREKGWEAYEFHDRLESYVTVGSFDDGQRLADGRIALTSRDAQIIINTFGAATPNNVFEKPAAQDRELENLQKKRFDNLFSQGYGKTAAGFHPKRCVGVPLDIIPEPVSVPRKSISSAYARN
ncbi:hypothetical protein [Bythopirellula polymerisocia]|uniref:Uncharacterized protein n=1 Tax=Bythopirellula polymerisocia TaxID=2528003 RepID=A0A5C6CUT4_9BACT|nr:hypothetical protein [Bythopirellula polymerisocia]TWU28302.1 hypothetical protein Pla144_15890 [Bythopirellula polymerisocia]